MARFFTIRHMLLDVTFEINGHKEDVGAVWVHLRSPDTRGNASYRIRVENSCLYQVFDQYRTKELTTSWVTFIDEHIRELGTFILEAYIENIANILEERRNLTDG
ncbi:MAG: hypothetical protein J2P41_09440 [Blastocatellia bacterium]|nr:hypothetical protein [Blastocatellia bacterium]